MQKFQGGGTPVFGLDPNAGGQSYKQENNNLFNATTMPLESGLQAYMGMQQLQNQQKQFELQRQELAHRIQIDDKKQLLDDYKAQATLRDDFFNIDVLAEDAPRYQQKINTAIPQELRDRAAKGEKGAMDEIIRRSTTLFMDPEINQILGKTKQSEKAWKSFVELPVEMKKYVTNITDVIDAHVAGKAIPNFNFDKEAFDKDQLDFKNSLEQDKIYKRNLQENQALKLEQETEKIKQDNYLNEQIRLGKQANSMKALGITGTYEEQTPEIKAKIDAKNVENDIKLVELKTELEKTKIKAAEITNKIDESKLKIFEEQLIKTGDPILAGMASGITKMEVDELVKLKILQSSTSIEDAAAKIKDFQTKTSDVNYHTDKVSNQGYQQDSKSSDRLYPNHVRNSEGTEIKSVTINGVVIPNKKESFPDDNSISIEIRYGKPYLKVKESNKAKDWLKSNYKWDWDSGYNDDIYDFIEKGKKPGTIYDNNELHIPIEDESAPTQTKTTSTRPPAKPVNPNRKQGI